MFNFRENFEKLEEKYIKPSADEQNYIARYCVLMSKITSRISGLNEEIKKSKEIKLINLNDTQISYSQSQDFEREVYINFYFESLKLKFFFTISTVQNII